MRHLAAALLALLLVAATSTPAPASVSVMLATPTEVKLGVSVDGRGIVFPLEYPRRHGPVSLSAGRHQLSVKVGATILKSSSRTLSAGSRYLAAIAGPVGNLSVVWIKLGSPPSATTARLRLVNLIADTPPLALRRGSDTLDPSTAFGKTSSMATLAPGALPIEVGRPETGAMIYAATPALQAGKAYTLLVHGTAARPEGLLIVEP